MGGRLAIMVSGPNDGYALDVLGAEMNVRSTGRPGEMFFAEHPVPAGYEVPLHVHRDEDELFYILEGEITLRSAESECVAAAGSFVHLPRGIAHGFANRTARPARMLVVASADGGALPAFTEIDRAGREGRLSPDVVAGVLAANRIDLV